MPAYVDSLEKIVRTYMAGVAAEPFDFEGERFEPKREVQVSPLLLRGYTCPPGCGACCPRFSLVYLPAEERPYDMPERRVTVNGRSVQLYSDAQDDHGSPFCRNLDMRDGRCGIHGQHPFHCDFELIRFLHSADKVVIVSKLFGRAWNMLRIDGERGAECEMLPHDVEWQADVVRRLRRLHQWTEHFGIRTHLPAIIGWAETGPHPDALRLYSEVSA